MKKLLLLVMVLVCGSAISQNNTKMDAEKGPRISFVSDVYDYGTIYVNSGHDGLAEFVFINKGDAPLVLSNVRAGCGCTSPFWHKEPVLPGDSAKVVLKYSTMMHPHNINRTAVVMSNDISNPNVVIRITGNVAAKPEEVMPEKYIDRDFSPLAR